MSEKMEKEITELLLKNAFEEIDEEKCNEIIEKYKDTEPEYSEEHRRRMQKLFRKRKGAPSWKKGLKRAAMIILAIFISGTMALQVDAVKIQLKNWYYEVTDKAFHIGNSTANLPGFNEIDTPIYVLSDEFVEKYGFSVNQQMNKNSIYSKYQNINGKYVILFQYSNETNIRIDNNSGKMVKQKINDKDVIIVYREEDISIYYTENNNKMCLYTNDNKQDIEELIHNVVIKS